MRKREVYISIARGSTGVIVTCEKAKHSALKRGYMHLHVCGKPPFYEGYCLGIHDVACSLPLVRMFEARKNFQKWTGAHKNY